jgi:hypothetical protein
MVKDDDYLDYCPHCGIERYAVQRSINDLVKAGGGVLDFSRVKEEVLAETDPGFRDLVEKAYDKYKRQTPVI